MTMRRLSGLALLLPLFLSCSDDSYVVVSVLARSGSVDGVAQFRVSIGNSLEESILHYPKGPSESSTIDTIHPITFSVEFGSGKEGTATIEVEPLSSSRSVLGYGKATVEIAEGKVSNVDVLVVPGAVRPAHGMDSGSLACDPYSPTTNCGGNQTCGLICDADQPSVSMCYLAGSAKPGEACSNNNDCEPGLQCFSFIASGCSVRTCLRFCNSDDAACGEQAAYCNVPIQCGITPFQTCSRPCDPTGVGTGGCAAGLACFVYAGDTTDCACPGLGGVGSPCTQNSGCGGSGCSGCQAGLSCVVPTGGTSGTCRPICDLAALICPSGTSCHAFEKSTRKIFGFCQ
jgi:hypothetical protein